MFKDKIVLILGGTGSVGSAISRAFTREGAVSCCHGRGGEYAAELSKSAATKDLIDRVFNKYGGIDIIVNSVSHPALVGMFGKKTWRDFSDHLNVQLKSCIETTQLVLPYMKQKRWGRIINILSSTTIGQPPASLSDYVTAKYALLGLTKCLARELGKFGINVNAVSPSFIKNSFIRNVPEKLTEIMISQTPRGRLATPEDVAGAVLFLASDAADFITGENLIVSGGSIMD